MLKFEEVSKNIKDGLYLKKGVPDARYNSSYKYTLYYTGSNAICAVCKTLKEVIEESNNTNNITV